MSEFSSWDSGVEHSPLRARFGHRTRVCINCGGKTKRKIIKYKKKKHTEEAYRYCCLECGKQISPWTQFGYEDNEKRSDKIYKQLLKFGKPEQIKKVWIDQSGNVLNYLPELENLSKIMFLVTIDETEFKIPCSYTEKLIHYYESPISIKKDKGIKKALIKFKKQLGEK